MVLLLLLLLLLGGLPLCLCGGLCLQRAPGSVAVVLMVPHGAELRPGVCGDGVSPVPHHPTTWQR